MTNPGLRVSSVSRRYGGRTVLNGISLSVRPGEVVGLLGPNGAGKTTCMDIVAGRVQPHTGTVVLGDLILDGMPLWRRVRSGLGYLSQESAIIADLSVRANIGLANATRELAESLIGQMGLIDVAEQPAGTLSGGERRRLEIARCLALSPKVIVMDEPFSGVDPVAVEGLQEIIASLAEKGTGILLSDHAVQATLAVCHRAIILDGGEMMAQGTPVEVAANPDVRARYLGPAFMLAQAARSG